MAYSLDGGMDHLWNIAPQAPRLNTHSPGQTLVWLNEETDSVNFLRQNRNGRILQIFVCNIRGSIKIVYLQHQP